MSPPSQATKVLWSPSPERSCGAGRSRAGRPSAASLRGEVKDPRGRSKVGITSGLNTPRPAPRGSEVTAEPSAMLYVRRLRAQLHGPGAVCPRLPSAQPRRPRVSSVATDHPFPPSSLFSGTEGDWREGGGCSPSQNESDPEDRQALNRPGVRWFPLKGLPRLPHGPALPLPELGRCREGARAAKSLSSTEPDTARRPEMPRTGSVPPPCPPEAFCRWHLSEYLGVLKL